MRFQLLNSVRGKKDSYVALISNSLFGFLILYVNSPVQGIKNKYVNIPVQENFKFEYSCTR